MKIDKLSLPHPVLGLGDDVEGSYQVSPGIKLGRERITIIANHGLSNETLEDLMDQKSIAFCTEINCPPTFYRKSSITIEANQVIEIEAADLRGKTDVFFYITAIKDIPNYSIRGANPDYEGFTFDIKKGDVLAYGGSTSFIAAKKWEELKSISAFLIIRKGEKEDGPFDITLNLDKIVVYLSKNDYETFRRASRYGFDPIFHSSVVVPALIYALQQVMTADEGAYEGLSWHQVLEFRKNNDDNLSKIWSLENIPQIAQILLDNPLTRTLSRIENIIDTSFNVEL